MPADGIDSAWSVLVERARALFDIDLGRTTLERLSAFTGTLLEWSKKTNLVSVDSVEELVYRHVLDSLAPVMFLGGVSSVADVGSGAGFPGLPLAIALPPVEVRLLESRRRRANFLRHAIRVLGIANVQVLEARAEEVASRSELSDVTAVVGRAVRPEMLADLARALPRDPKLILMRKASAQRPVLSGFANTGARAYELPTGRRHEVLEFRRF